MLLAEYGRIISVSRQIIPLYVPNADHLVDAAESLENHETCILNEFFQTRDKEEVSQENCLTLVQFSASRFKVKVHVQVFNELCNRIPETKNNT